MTHKRNYEIFIICPDCEYREHFFSDQKLFARCCPGCGRKFGMGDLPIKGLASDSDADSKHVEWLRLNYRRDDRIKMDRDAGVTVVTHELSPD